MEPNKEEQGLNRQESSQQEADRQEIKLEATGVQETDSEKTEAQEKESKEGILHYYTAIGAAAAVLTIVIIIFWQISGKTISETLGESENEKKTENSANKEEENATDDAILAVIEESLDEPVRIVSEAAIAANEKREQLLAEAAAAEEEARRQAEEEAAKAEAEARAQAEAEKAAQEQAQAEVAANAAQSGSESYAPTPTQPVQSTDSSAYVDEVIRLVNVERANAGLPPLKKNGSVCQAANTRAGETAVSFSHTRPDGRSCFTILEERGISYTSCGENIAAGYRTPEEVVRGWMNSPGHRANILNEGFEEIGVGVAEVNGTIYWVQLFIRVNW